MSANSSSKPALVAPVNRYLAVSDIDRSTHFYRDLLGFEVQSQRGSVEAVYGPARIIFGFEDSALDSTLRPRPRGAAMLFFETDNVAGMREAIRARGGEVTEREKVNWLKMEMFQIRDPDGHTLWFGQSFHGPDKPRPQSLLTTVIPNFPLSDVAAGVTYYQHMLGFNINYAQDDFAVMYRDDIRIILMARNEERPLMGACYVYVRDADALYEEYKAKSVNVQGEPVSQPWGLRDFSILDLEGNRIAFGQPFE
jgi:catechol 2,3-dioxygenase-like lactoylglutathione lyase family enzyme